jgi:hypothetical protein
VLVPLYYPVGEWCTGDSALRQQLMAAQAALTTCTWGGARARAPRGAGGGGGGGRPPERTST